MAAFIQWDRVAFRRQGISPTHAQRAADGQELPRAVSDRLSQFLADPAADEDAGDDPPGPPVRYRENLIPNPDYFAKFTRILVAVDIRCSATSPAVLCLRQRSPNCARRCTPRKKRQWPLCSTTPHRLHSPALMP